MKPDEHQVDPLQRRRTTQLNVLSVASAAPPALYGLAGLLGDFGVHSAEVVILSALMLLWFLSFPVLAYQSLSIARENGWRPFPAVLNLASAAAWLCCAGAFLLNLARSN
jgi:hypothetical protein